MCSTVRGRAKIRKSVPMLRPAWLQKILNGWQYAVPRFEVSQKASRGTQTVKTDRRMYVWVTATTPNMILVASGTYPYLSARRYRHKIEILTENKATVYTMLTLKAICRGSGICATNVARRVDTDLEKLDLCVSAKRIKYAAKASSQLWAPALARYSKHPRE